MKSNDQTTPSKPTETEDPPETGVVTEFHSHQDDNDPPRHEEDGYDDVDLDESKADYDAEETNAKETNS
jgi:hypothetical protein